MTKVRDIAEISSGYSFRSSMANFKDGDIKLIQPNNLDNFDLNSLKSIDAPATKLNKGDLLLSNRGKFRAMAMPVDGDFVFPSSIYLIKINSEKYIPEFVAVYLNSNSGQSQLTAISSSSQISNLTKTALSSVELPDIALDVQAKIAKTDDILSKYRLLTSQKVNLLETVRNNLIKELV